MIIQNRDAACGKFQLTFMRTLCLCAILGAALGSRLASALTVTAMPSVGTNPAVWHQTYAGTATYFKAVAFGGTPPYTVQWDYLGNGTFAAGTVYNTTDLEGAYTFPTTLTNTQIFVATVEVTDSTGATATANYKVKVFPDTIVTDSIKVDKTIDDGIWYLHKTLTRTTSGTNSLASAYLSEDGDGGEQTLGAVGVAIQAYQNRGHRLSGSAATNPYVTDLQQMYNYMFSYVSSYAIGLKPGDTQDNWTNNAPVQSRTGDVYGPINTNQYNPDVLGISLGFGLPGGTSSTHFCYYNSIFLTAIATSGVPLQTVPAGFDADISGQTYSYLVQGMVDYVANRQGDVNQGLGRGGWHYAPNSSSVDGSMEGWVTTSLLWAEKSMAAMIPAFVRYEYQNYGMPNVRNAATGAFGYGGNTNWLNLAKTGGNLNSYDFLGIPATDPMVQQSLDYIAANWGDYTGDWNNPPLDTSGWVMNFGSAYPMYSVMKGCRALSITTIGTHDWYSEYRSALLTNLNPYNTWSSNGMWNSPTTSKDVSAAMFIEVLELIFLTSPPVAVGRAVATNVPPNSIVTLYHDESYDLDPTHQLVKFEWDFGVAQGGGVYNGSPDGTYDYTGTSLSAPVRFKVGGPGVYKPVLRVTDNTFPVPQTALDTDAIESTITVTAANANHPPAAIALPPGTGFSIADYIYDQTDATLSLNGTSSYDPDTGDSVTAYAWDTNGDFSYSGASGSTPTLTSAQLNPNWLPNHTYTIGLRVTDNGQAIFGTGNLSATATASVYVSADSRPTANSITVATNINTQVPVSLTGTSIRNRALSAIITSLPLKGTLYQTPDGITRGVSINQGDTVTGAVLRVLYVPPAGDNASPYTSFTFQINDTVKTSVAATVTVNVINNAPVISAIGNQTMSAGGTLNLQVQAADPNGPPDVLLYSLDLAPQGATISAAGLLTYTAPLPGTFPVTVRVANSGNPPLSSTVNFLINAIVGPAVNIVGAPATGLIGNTINLGCTVTDQADGASFTYAWSVTSSNSQVVAGGAGTTYSFAPNAAGTYTVNLVVTDNYGNSGSDSKTIVVPALAAAITLGGGPYPEGSAVLASAMASGSIGDTFSYNWHVTKNGMDYASASDGPGLGTSDNYSFTPNAPGTYVVMLTATDKTGAVAVAPSQTMVATAVNPVVAIAGAPLSSPEGTAINLTSTVTDPGTAETFTYAWTVSLNGTTYTTGTGATLSFTPNFPGPYSVALAVTSSGGGIGSASKAGTITVATPTATIVGAPANSPEGTAINATSVVTDPGSAETFTYAWTVTKNSAPFTSGTNANVSFIPDSPGSYQVSLTVTTSGGGSVTAPAQTIVVGVANPTVAIVGAPQSSLEGSTIALTSTVSDPGSTETFTYAWSVSANNGQVVAGGTNAAFSFTPNDNGIYTVTLIATSINGGIGSGAAVVDVRNVQPTATIVLPGGNYPGGSPIMVQGIATDPGTVDTFAYNWRVTKNGLDFASTSHGPGLGASNPFVFTPDMSGQYNVSLLITDKDGATGVAPIQTITVSEVTPVVQITGAPSSIAEHIEIPLGCTVTTPESADTFTYAWTASSDGATVASGTGANFKFTPDNGGVYTVSVTGDRRRRQRGDGQRHDHRQQRRTGLGEQRAVGRREPGRADAERKLHLHGYRRCADDLRVEFRRRQLDPRCRPRDARVQSLGNLYRQRRGDR